MSPKKRKVRKARLDADKKAKPMTEIVAHHPAGHCILPGIKAISYEVRDINPHTDGE